MSLINGLHFNNFRGDIYGGLTAAVVALPLAMAMGVTSGVGPIAGMYGAIFVGFFAALFGGTPAQVSGPTGPMTVVMAAIFIQYTSLFPENPAQGAALAFSVVVLGGIFQIFFGLLKIGKYIELVPHPVVSGFMTGIGVIIIFLQLGPLMGQVSSANPLLAIQALPEYLQNIQSDAFILSSIVLTIVYGVPRFLPTMNQLLPSPLLGLIIGTAFYLLFMTPGTPIIGTIPTGFPEFHLPIIEPSLLFSMIVSGLTLAGLGSIDSLLTSLVADNITRTQHQSDRELIGQGIGNTIAGLFGGLPGAGATMRTVVNVKAGGRTPISGALHAVVLLAIVLGAGALAHDIPKAVLAAILIKVGTDIIDWDYLKQLHHAPKAGILIMLVVFTMTVTVDLLLAVGVGMVMASFVFMQRMTQIQIDGIDTITASEEKHYLSNEESALLDQANHEIMLLHLNGPMSFSSAKAIVRQHASVIDYRIMILDLSDVPMIDYTTTKALNDILLDTIQAGRIILLCGANKTVFNILKKQDVTRHFQQKKPFNTRLDALQEANILLKNTS